MAELPIVDGGVNPVVSVLVDDQPRKMLLDTGGFWSLIDPSIATDHKIKPSPVSGLLGLNGAPLTKIAVINSVQIGTTKFEHIDFYVSPDGMGSLDGTLGANWLQNFDVEIDPVKNTASLFSKDHCAGQVVYWPHREVAEIPIDIDNREHHITVPLVLNGKEITALIDTGSSETFLNLDEAKRLFDLTPQSPGVQPVSSFTDSHSYSYADQHGVTRTLYRYQFKSLQMGDITFHNPWVTFADITTPLEGTGMVLGMHQLHGLHLYFAYKERKLYATSASGDIAEAKAVK